MVVEEEGGRTLKEEDDGVPETRGESRGVRVDKTKLRVNLDNMTGWLKAKVGRLK